MIQLETLAPLVAEFGLWIVAAAAIIEGPIVTVLSTALARQGLLPLVPLAAILLLGDLVGDLLHYALGRRGLAQMPRAWRRWLGLGPARALQLTRHFGQHGGKTFDAGQADPFGRCACSCGCRDGPDAGWAVLGVERAGIGSQKPPRLWRWAGMRAMRGGRSKHGWGAGHGLS